jgi:hypothetical protein
MFVRFAVMIGLPPILGDIDPFHVIDGIPLDPGENNVPKLGENNTGLNPGKSSVLGIGGPGTTFSELSDRIASISESAGTSDGLFGRLPRLPTGSCPF